MADHVDITLWIDRRWKDAIEKHLKDETLQEHLEDVLDELCNQLPEREYERISAEIYAEDVAEREAREAARTYAAYHVTERGQEWYFKTSPGEELLDTAEKLSGKEITSAGHLSARIFSFGDEIIEMDGKLNFYVRTEFDVDAAFGTFVCTDKNDDWLNIYANYDMEKNRPCDTLELNLCKADGTEETWSYRLNAAEREVLLQKMEEYCQQQTGMSLRDYAQQFRAEPEQRQGPVMKL